MSFVITEKDFRQTYKLQKYADDALIKIGFPYKPNLNVVRVVSLLTFDGHLTPNKKMFLFTSGKKSELREIKLLVKHEFNITGKFRKINTNSFGTSYEYRLCSAHIGRLLGLLDVPCGNKVLKKFVIPTWIIQHPEFSREYVKTAFECEGSLWNENNNRTRIGFKINKEESLIKDGVEFVEQIRQVLHNNKIETTKIWTTDSNLRKDGHKTKSIQFRIKEKSNNDFINLFHFRLKGLRRHGTADKAA